MKGYKVVEENPDLVRDPYSGAIVNTNSSAYRSSVEAAKKRKIESEKLEGAVQDINNLKNDINEVKSLLQELIKRV